MVHPVVLFVAASLQLGQAAVPQRVLPARPQSSIPEAFSDISAIRELSDGRVLVLDTKETTLEVVDFASGGRSPVGKRGGGPGEYMRPLRLIALPGDTTLVVDAGTGRMLVVGADAHVGATLELGAEEGALRVLATSVRDADARGAFYLTGQGVRMNAAGPQALDSAPLLRLNRRTTRIDTLAYLQQPKTQITMRTKGKVIQSVEITRAPFAAGDELAVRDDGEVIIARLAPYRVDRLTSGGALTRGTPLAHRPLAVGEAEKREYLSHLRSGIPVAEMPWPDELPAFLPGALVVTPEGEAWVRRSMAAGAASAVYDVVGRAGTPVAALTMARRVRIAMVTARWVYAVRTDEDDLQYLERYPRS
jgi:hypothetical protein